MMLSLLEVLHQLPAPRGEYHTAGVLGHSGVGVLCARRVKEATPLDCVSNSYYPAH